MFLASNYTLEDKLIVKIYMISQLLVKYNLLFLGLEGILMHGTNMLQVSVIWLLC